MGNICAIVVFHYYADMFLSYCCVCFKNRLLVIGASDNEAMRLQSYKEKRKKQINVYVFLLLFDCLQGETVRLFGAGSRWRRAIFLQSSLVCEVFDEKTGQSQLFVVFLY